MGAPKLSIILPVYNGESFLNRAVDSVINSTLDSWELILVNDGSTDSTEKICKEYCLQDKRIHHISQDNRGLSAARNAGFSIALGTYVMFLDADDYVESTYYEIVLNSAIKTNADFIVTGFTREFLSANGRIHVVECKWPRQYVTSAEGIRNISEHPYFYNIYIHAWNKVYRRDQLLKYGITFDETLKYGEDVPYNLKVLSVSKNILLLEITGYHYVCRTVNRLTTRWNPLLPEYNRQIFREISDHERGRWGLINSTIPACMYLRGCFLTWEKAIKSGQNYPEVKELIQEILDFPETQEALETIHTHAPAVEFAVYRNLMNCHYPRFIYFAVCIRQKIKMMLGR